MELKDWTLRTAQDAVAELVTERLTRDAYEENRDLIESGDHFRGGKGWVGPKGSETVRTEVLKAVEPQFTPADACGEVVERFTDALLKVEADVAFEALEPAGDETPDGGRKPSDEQKRAGAEMLTLTRQWWDRVRLWPKARNACRRSRWSTRGTLRTGVPTGLLEPPAAEGAPPRLPAGLDFASALARVQLYDDAPDAAGVWVDPDTQKAFGIVLFEEEVVTDGLVTATKPRAQVWSVEPDGLQARVIGDGIAPNEAPFRFPGVTRLPVTEMEAELLLTDPVRRQQKQLNLFQSILTRLGEVAGFPERVTTNAQPFGIWLTTQPNTPSPLDPKVINGVTHYFHPWPRTLGASTLTELVGFAYGAQEDGRESITTPTFQKIDPTDPEFAIKAASYAYAVILRQCHQAHVLGAENLQRSGVSIQQARADFEADVQKGKGPLESLITAVIESAIATASAMSSEFPGFLQQYRCTVTLHVSTGPISPEERRENREDVTAGLLAPESAMARGGIEDTDAERASVLESPTAKFTAAALEAQAVKAWGEATGLPWDICVRLAGVPEERLQSLQGTAFDPNAAIPTAAADAEVLTAPANDVPGPTAAPDLSTELAELRQMVAALPAQISDAFLRAMQQLRTEMQPPEPPASPQQPPINISVTIPPPQQGKTVTARLRGTAEDRVIDVVTEPNVTANGNGNGGTNGE